MSEAPTPQEMYEWERDKAAHEARAPEPAEVEALEVLALAEQERARKIQQIARDQTGGIRRAGKAKAKRKQAKAARRRNR